MLSKKGEFGGQLGRGFSPHVSPPKSGIHDLATGEAGASRSAS